MTPARAAVRLAVIMYATVLRLYPAGFRRACGAAMLETFEAVSRDRARSRGALRLLLASVPDYLDALASAWRVRRTSGRATAASGIRITGHPAEALWQDARGAARWPRAQPALAAFIVSTLGFAIAANAGLFSIVDAVLTVVTQTADLLTIEHKVPNSDRALRYAYKLDGSKSVNHNGAVTLTTTSRWEEVRLVTEGTTFQVTNQGEDSWMLREVMYVERGELVLEQTYTREGRVASSGRRIYRGAGSGTPFSPIELVEGRSVAELSTLRGR